VLKGFGKLLALRTFLNTEGRYNRENAETAVILGQA